VRVKVNVAQILRHELARRSWGREQVAIGAATDPYQPAEGRYRLTRACIVELARGRTPFNIITRGPLVIQDRDVLAEASIRAQVSVSVSIATMDEGLAAKLEPGVAPPRQRLRAIRLLTDGGIRAGVALAPVLPGLTDAPASLAAVLRAARDAGATHAWSNLLNLRTGTREHFLTVLAREWPEEVARYERLYPAGGSGYLGRTDAEPMERLVHAARGSVPITDRRRIMLTPPPEPEQLGMAI
jgi:DNA repair photolyase